MSEVASLIIKVDSIGAKSATGDLDRLTASSGRSERAADQLARSWKVAGAAIGTAVVGATGAFLKLAESHQNITSRLRLATKGAEEFNAAYSATYDIAQRTGTALDGVANLFARLSQSSTELGLSQSQVAQITETVTQAFIVSGATAQEASGGIRQLTQAMAGGTLRAEEFNSIIESSPRIVQAMADHFGVSFGKVRQLVNDGKVSSEEFAQALLASSQAVQAEFDTMPVTVGRAMQEVRTALQRMAGQANESSGATDGLAEAIRGLARELESEAVRDGFASVVGGLSQIITYGTKAIGVLDRIGTGLQGLRGQAAGAEKILGGLTYFDRDMVRAGWEQYQGASGDVDSAFRAAPDKAPEAHPGIDFTRPAPEDYKPSRLAEGLGGTKERTRATQELTAAEREHRAIMEDIAAHEGVVESTRMEYANAELRRIMEKEEADARASDSVQRLIADLEFEASLIGKTAVEQEKMIALRYAGAAATDEQQRAISELVQRMEEARAQGEFQQDLKSLFVDIGMDIGNATGALDRFFNTLKRRALETLAEQMIISMFGGGGGGQGSATGGFWSSLFGAFTGGGRAAGGPVQAGQGYIVGEHGPELFSPGHSGRVHPLGQAIGGGSANVKLEVINNGPPMQARTETTTAPDGSQLIRLVLDAVAGDMAQGGRTAQAMKGRFGLREAV